MWNQYTQEGVFTVLCDILERGWICVIGKLISVTVSRMLAKHSFQRKRDAIKNNTTTAVATAKAGCKTSVKSEKTVESLFRCFLHWQKMGNLQQQRRHRPFEIALFFGNTPACTGVGRRWVTQQQTGVMNHVEAGIKSAEATTFSSILGSENEKYHLK